MLRFRYRFADFHSVSIHVVPRARVTVYRVLANGPKGSKLLTFTFSEGGANQCVANIRQATGWSSTEAPALKSA